MADNGISPTPVQRYDLSAKEQLGIEFETYLYGWVMHIRAEQQFSRQLAEAAVTLHVRSRGVTISDMVSGYGTRQQTAGQWLQYDPNQDGEVHPINIIGPAVTTNKNACLQSNAEIDVDSANASAKSKQIAMRWKRVAEYFERTGWTESKRAFMFDDVQKGGTLLVKTYCDPFDKQIVPRLQEKERGIGAISCAKCGHTDILDIDDFEEEGETEMPCPQCQAPARAAIASEKTLLLDEVEEDIFEIKDKVIPFFNFSIDMYGAKAGGLNTAGWLNEFWLRDLNYMQTHYPGMSFQGPGLWSYQARCDWALSRGRWDYLNRQPRQVGWGWGHERYEEQAIYLHEDSYSGYRAPQDYKFVDQSGNVTFEIKQGQTIAEAQRAMFGYNPGGFKFYWCEDRLLTIPLVTTEEPNLRHVFSDLHWSRESGSYLSSPNYSIVYIQDDITLLNTLNHNISARNAVVPLFYDSLVFEQGDFSNEFIGSKNAAMEPGFDIRKAVASLPVPTPSPYLSQQMQWLWSIKDSVSQVTPAMRGEQDKGTPYAAQRQQLEQSYGNLTSVLKSFAQLKVSVFRNKARLAAAKWTNKQFQEVGSMFGEPWTDEDVEEMCSIDLDRDLIVSYRPGSEIPSTPMSKEMKFFGALGQLMPFVQAFPQLIGTDKLTQILQKIDEFGEFDFDLTGLEVNELVAQKRYSSLAELCAGYQNMTMADVSAARSEVVDTQPPSPEQIQQSIQIAQAAPDNPEAIAAAKQLTAGTPVTAFDLIAEEVFMKAQIQFSEYEDLSMQKGFFIEMLRGEIGKTKPNFCLIAILEELLGMITEFMSGKEQEEMAANPEIQAAIAADEAERADAAADREIEVGKMALEAEMQDKELADRKEARETDLMRGLLTQQADHEQAAEMKGIDMAIAEEVAEAVPKPAPKKPAAKRK